MTEPMFQAPLPPEMQQQPSIQENKEVSPSMDSVPQNEEIQPSVEQNKKIDIELIKSSVITYLWWSLGGCFLIGLLLGNLMGGGTEVREVVRDVGKVVSNPDITTDLKRCGAQDNVSDSCVFYIQNTKSRDVYANNFFAEAAKQTGRSVYLIEIENPQYLQYMIKPGYLAKIKIPKIR